VFLSGVGSLTAAGVKIVIGQVVLFGKGILTAIGAIIKKVIAKHIRLSKYIRLSKHIKLSKYIRID
jgi:hypothetical protein